MEKPPKKLLEKVKNKIRLKHYSDRAEDAYIQWIRRYSHPKEISTRSSQRSASKKTMGTNFPIATPFTPVTF